MVVDFDNLLVTTPSHWWCSVSDTTARS